MSKKSRANRKRNNKQKKQNLNAARRLEKELAAAAEEGVIETAEEDAVATLDKDKVNGNKVGTTVVSFDVAQANRDHAAEHAKKKTTKAQSKRAAAIKKAVEKEVAKAAIDKEDSFTKMKKDFDSEKLAEVRDKSRTGWIMKMFDQSCLHKIEFDNETIIIARYSSGDNSNDKPHWKIIRTTSKPKHSVKVDTAKDQVEAAARFFQLCEAESVEVQKLSEKR